MLARRRNTVGRKGDTHEQSDFTTGLVGARILYGFSPRAFLNYVVDNDRRDTTSGDVLERAVILKVTNLFSF